MSPGLFTNHSSRRDFVMNELLDAGRTVADIFIATAFFTEFEVLEQLATAKVTIRLIVRLGFPTNPDALAKALRLKNLQLRYFSDPSFHPKLYIFGNSKALVGSANLTRAALLSNQEVAVTIDADDERFAELAGVFAEYWSAAKVLTEDELLAYTRLYRVHCGLLKELEDLDHQVHQQIGRHAFPNIQRGLPAQNRENIFLDGYRRAYQSCIDAYRTIQEAYIALGRRKFPPEHYPLRLEINLFINFVRDVHAGGESWQKTPLGWNDLRATQVQNQLNEWIERELTKFETHTVFDSYPKLNKLFSNRKHLLQASDDELVEGLRTVTSFDERLRFFDGGWPALREAFLQSNQPRRIRESLAYLIFGPGDPIGRMGALIFDPTYKLAEFGQANVQELIGWINPEELPVINGRTTKILRYFGFEVQQLS